ncbi:D-isomer specific 2-hydroxyacid dehydrogenase family protein [Maribellus comscasis]|uniref:D-isomer specific 2-hydroxyacid dehydrogenase family protein n=1 Tax=Maribellus comscasis TaxID=2681766 RepID=UPI001C2D3388|nr:D-isomer specific 2-hydroxyacid dehydrogenase family protein [Maribellus comscasis]
MKIETMGRTKIQITAYELRDDERVFFEEHAKALNIRVQYTSGVLSESLLDLAEGSIAVTVLGHSLIDEGLLQKLHKMGVRSIATRTIGYNHIDVSAAKSLGIKISTARYAPNGVADYTVMLILMSLRKYKQAMYRANINDYSLPGLRGKELRNLTVGIIGTGSIGEQVIKNLSGFGCKILAYSNSKKEHIEKLASYVSLDELYKQSDIISFHIPLNEGTRRMVNADAIEKMKDGVILVNCARGELMNIPDVVKRIEKQKIGALALDVFENETGIYHLDRRNDIISNRDMAYMRQFPNVIMTQHIAFYTDAAVSSMVNCTLQSIISFVETGASRYEIV